MFSGLFSRKSKQSESKKNAPRKPKSKVSEIRREKVKHILVIDGDRKKDWRAIFAGATVRVRRGTAPPRPPSGAGKSVAGVTVTSLHATAKSAASSSVSAASAAPDVSETASAASEWEHIPVKVHQG